MDRSEVKTHKNFITNSDEIIEKVLQEKHNFKSRAKGEKYEFNNKRYGNCVMDSMFSMDMSEELKTAIFRTIDVKKCFDDLLPDEIVINRYKPGSFLPKHVDSFGMYWKFMLVILKAKAPHLKLYSDDKPEGFFVEEEAGTYVETPLSMEHEVTLMHEGEEDRYSMVFIWHI